MRVTIRILVTLLATVFLLSQPVSAVDYFCPDVDHNGTVDLSDYSELTGGWLQYGPHLAGDIIFDGVVDFADLACFCRMWLLNSDCEIPTGQLHSAGSISQLRTLWPQPGDVALVGGYYAPSDDGGGTFIYDPYCVLPDDGGAVIDPAVVGRWIRQWNGQVNAKEFGAKGDGLNDDTAALQAAARYVYHHDDVHTLFLPAGTYLISDTLYMTDDQPSDFPPNLIGAGSSAAFLQTAPNFPVNTPLIDYRGSGQALSHAELHGLSIEGSNTDNQIGIQLRGAQGLQISECRFHLLRYGVRFHNTDSGAATEFNLIKNSEFSTVGTALHYYRTGVNSSWSFQGNGIKGASLSHSQQNIPLYHVQDLSGQSQPALVFHAPLEIISFGGNDFGVGRILFKSNVDAVHSVYGGLRQEGELTLMAEVAGAGSLILDDYLTSLGGIDPADLQWQGYLARYGPAHGSFNGSTIMWHPPSKWSLPLQAGFTSVDGGGIMGGVMSDWLSLFLVTITGPDNYDYRYLVLGTHYPGTVNIISTIKTYNGSGVGPPGFSLDSSGRLRIYNAYYSDAYAAVVYETPLGSFGYPTTN